MVERLAPRLGLVQVPNARSSHTVPTPLGGGLAIAATTGLAAAILALHDDPGLWPAAFSILLVGTLGLADDLYDLSPALRFPVQGLIFIALIWATGPVPAIALPFGMTLAGPSLLVVIFLISLWWLNLFNFMDGIDGMAGSQAVLLLIGMALVWWSVDPLAWQSPTFALTLSGAAATAGFLLRNWPPARIFMGDMGSNVLALLIFFVGLITIHKGQLDYQPLVILPAVLVTDASVTLLRRLSRGERPWQAHRRHAYQQLSRVWGHQSVTLVYCGLTIIWTFPLAVLAQHQPDWGWWPCLIAYTPITGFALAANAGGKVETKPS